MLIQGVPCLRVERNFGYYNRYDYNINLYKELFYEKVIVSSFNCVGIRICLCVLHKSG